MRRRSENDLGETLYYGLPYHGRWIMVAAKRLIDKGLITQDELANKVEEVRNRKAFASLPTFFADAVGQGRRRG